MDKGTVLSVPLFYSYRRAKCSRTFVSETPLSITVTAAKDSKWMRRV